MLIHIETLHSTRHDLVQKTRRALAAKHPTTLVYQIHETRTDFYVRSPR